MHAYHELTTRPNKLALYRQVVDLIRTYCSTSDGSLRCLTLPGLSWTFEKFLSKDFEGDNLSPFFISFEKEKEIFDRCHNFIPYKKTSPQKSRLKECSYVFTDNAYCLNADVNQFICKEWKTSKEQYFNYFRSLGSWDFIWLDYFSKPTDTIAKTLNHLQLHCNKSNGVTPVMVTVYKGRESVFVEESMVGLLSTTSADGTLDRRRWLEFQLAGGARFPHLEFETLDFVEYSDTGHSKMVVIIGLLKH